ncbi:hypothetical protein C5F64_08795 [Photobacterium damselae subsp. damselae]|uniref:hypothetical protein n=1 Tax=Photobacterium damselae TaxID=38293 RepID=UPI000D05B9A4|nr:hypothetical protein [Photobacterium damselae]PSB88087.1 hypothetical protein C5F64_08795 [Photobacterium damselae subsp. damselae]
MIVKPTNKEVTMAFSILSSGEATYSIKDSDETFTTEEVQFVKEEINTYQSGYKEETTEIIGTYITESEHGPFIWTATTTISTYDSWPEIDYELTEQPENIENVIDTPNFEIDEDNN